MKINQNGFFSFLPLVLFMLAVFVAVGAVFYMIKNHEATKPLEAKVSKTEKSEPKKDESVDSRTPSDDQTVKNDITLVNASLNEYKANNRGNLPLLSSEVDNFNEAYLLRVPQHPITNEQYKLTQEEPEDHILLYLVGRKCNQDGTIDGDSSDGSYIVQAKLPSGGYYCLDND